MDQRQEPGLPASLLNGRLEGLSVPDLLWNLCRRRSTGVLQLTSRGITKKVYVDAGRIVFALSSDPNDRLGDLLLREGLITLDQMEAAIVHLTTGKRLGTILVAAGHLSPENLVRGVLNQVKGIVLGLFPWEEGEYAFVEGPLPTAEVVTLGMRTAEILLQGIRQIRAFTRIRKSVGPPATRYRLEAGWRTTLDGLDIRDGERMLLQRLDEAGKRGASVGDLCREVFLSNFEIYQALWAFLVLGVVDEVDRAEDPRNEGAIAGRVERGTLPEIFVRLAQQEVTGVLHMSRGTLERTLHIKAGQCVFATSNSVDDGLIAHLLRRGVISLADREETARRLLSNKRVGTILLEMGVIDESDLSATVREQLSEIIFDTFRWDQGDFQFLEGELPTIEEITLTRSIEELLFAGVRRITSWSRVREGCGGLGARLVLMPEYLSVLDKMTVGPEEWELISVLKTPKTVMEICRESVLGDFRSCQILWALRLLGGVGEAPLDVSLDSALGRFDAQPAVAAKPAPAPELERKPIPLSEADTSAEVISEPWRLAAERDPNAPPPPPSSRLQLDVSPLDGSYQISNDGLDVGTVAPTGGAPKFELGEPGTGLEDMRLDTPTATRSSFQMASAEEAAEEEAAAEAAAQTAAAEQRAVEQREAERAAAEAAELERIAAERAEAERMAAERAEAERMAAELAEAERIAAERAEAERIEAERIAAERAEAERVEAERIAAERAEAERFEMERIAAERAEAERIAAERAEAARLAAERAEAARLAAERAEAERAEAERMAAEAAARMAMDSNRTARLSRDEVESSLRAAAAAAVPEPAAGPVLDEVAGFSASIDLPAWEPPAELDGAIASFNARHVVLFRAMRAEIGAGAANFVRSCRAGLDASLVELFATADLRADGSWDPEGLKRSVIEHRIANANDGFATLLESELHRLRLHMGEKRAAALAEQLTAIQ